MICSSDEIAKQICFNQSGPKIKCVTLDGDVYDPSGLLTGGYTNQDKMLLKKYFEFHKLDV
jgi:structural maintenance of chromosome 2